MCIDTNYTQQCQEQSEIGELAFNTQLGYIDGENLRDFRKKKRSYWLDLFTGVTCGEFKKAGAGSAEHSESG